MRIKKFIETSAIFALCQTYDQVMGSFQKRLAVDGVHFVQALILTGLFFEDRPVQPSRLAENLKASRSNISHAIRDLERKSLIVRTTSPADARAYFIALTKAGRKLAPRLIKLLDTTQNQIEAAGGTEIVANLASLVKMYHRPGQR